MGILFTDWRCSRRVRDLGRLLGLICMNMEKLNNKVYPSESDPAVDARLMRRRGGRDVLESVDAYPDESEV